MRIYFEILLLIIAVAALLLALSPKNLQNQVCFEQNCFFVELAKAQTQKEKGLMFRQNLDKNAGMLFIFDKEDIYPFWMKNTLLPLDIIWIDSNNKVVFIDENSQPCQELDCPAINPDIKAKYVLEINAGTVKEIGLKVGDSASIAP